MVCEKCGKEIEIYESDEGHQCHKCGSIYCNDCMPRWEIIDDELVCKNCAKPVKQIEALSDFKKDIICFRDDDGIHTNVPQRIKQHSPTGFEWGYGGSGPADLALNILSLFAGQEFAERYHQDFKREFIASMPHEGGMIRREDIIQWIKEKEASV
jgi:DNA-directed RNA polymerase subunit RPC12/RpoP